MAGARPRRGRGARALAHALVPARQPGRGQRAHPPPRARASDATRPTPRPGSLRDAVQRLAARGTSRDELAATARAGRAAAGADRPPDRGAAAHDAGEARAHLRRAARPRRAPRRGEPAARAQLLATVQELWGSDELRAVSLTVLDEVRAGLVYFVSTLADEVPAVYRDLEAAVAEAYPDDPPPVPPLLTFGSWIGGDRDGNPNVTPETTAEALELMRTQCLRFLEGRGRDAGGAAVVLRAGDRPRGRPRAAAGRRRRALPRAGRASCEERNPEEPYRRAFSLVRERLRVTRRDEPEGYADPGELLADLRLSRALPARRRRAHWPPPADLRDTIRQVEVFGFHFARLDVREHATRHRAALDRGLRRAGRLRDLRRAAARAADRAARARDRRSAAADPPGPVRLHPGDPGGGAHLPHAARAARGQAPRRDRGLRRQRHRGARRPARGAAADEGGGALARRRPRRRAADRAAVRGRRDARGRRPHARHAARPARATAARCARSATTRR